jgi:hypothetical protein
VLNAICMAFLRDGRRIRLPLPLSRKFSVMRYRSAALPQEFYGGDAKSVTKLRIVRRSNAGLEGGQGRGVSSFNVIPMERSD